MDLAGSERLKETGSSEKEALRETGHINRSLFTLGQVLAALSRGGQAGVSHVPYRDSKLTQLLWQGLRGRGRVLMLACLAPLRQHSDDSLTTLHFASMALRVKSEPVVMLEPQARPEAAASSTAAKVTELLRMGIRRLRIVLSWGLS